MALSGSLTAGYWYSDAGLSRGYTLSWTATQSIANNQSTISWTLSTAGTYSGNVAERTLKVVLAGVTLVNKTDRVMRGPGKVASGSFTVTHASDGKYSFTGSIQAAVFYSSVNCSNSAPFTLNQIHRQATLTSAPNFTDEDNPTITYSNPAGSAVTELKACISWTGADDIVYRDISKTGTSYTFNFTEEERVALRKAVLSGSNSRSVRFYVTTWIGNTPKASTIDKTFTIINCEPTLSPMITDCGTNSTRLTGGDPNIIIKGHNYLEVSTGAVALKESSIISQSITCGNATIHAESGIMNNVESGTFVIKATDSRGNTTTQTVTKDLVEYVKLTCALSADNPTVDGDLELNITGNYFNGSFGAVYNSLNVGYRIKKSGEEWAVDDSGNEIWVNVNDSEIIRNNNDNTYFATVSITGLDYRNAYVIQARAADEVYYGYITTTERVVRSLPTFDWGEKDFEFHVPVFKDGNPMGYYPIGGIYTSSENINPGELFGGTWELARRFHGGELVAYGAAWNSSSGSKSFEDRVWAAFSDILPGSIYTDSICNYIPDILTGSSGTLWAQTKGIVGLIEVNVTLSGYINSGCYGIWFNTDNHNALPENVTLTGGGGLVYAGGYYSGASMSYFYNINDADTGTSFFLNPRWQPYGGPFTPCHSGIRSTLRAKAFAKGGTTYMWKRIA